MEVKLLSFQSTKDWKMSESGGRKTPRTEMALYRSEILAGVVPNDVVDIDNGAVD